MIYRLFANGVVLIHFAFIAFIVLGGLLVLRWPRLIWVHVPLAVWGVLVAWMGWICPLTPLENHFRRLAGQLGYGGGFIEHYLIPVMYPAGLTRNVQWALGAVVLVVNAWVYVTVWRRWRARRLENATATE